MEILEQFGIQPILLAAQIVNFLILLFILRKFLYGPILKVLDERKRKIADSLKNAEEIERRLKEIAEKEAEAILRSAKEGERIIKDASDYAVQLIEKGKKDYGNLINKGVEDVRKMHEFEKEIIMKEIKEDLAGLIILTFEKIIGKSAREEQKKVIEREVKDIS